MESTLRTPQPDAQNGRQTAPLDTGQAAGYAAGSVGLGAFFALSNAILPLFLARFTSSTVLISLMGSVDTVGAIAIQPLVGAWSDRLTRARNRRKPFLLAGALLCAVFLLLTLWAASRPPAIRLPLMVLFTISAAVGFNVLATPYRALLADISAPQVRGRLAAAAGLALVLGQSLLVGLGVGLEAKFAVAAATLVVFVAVTAIVVKEPALTTRQQEEAERVGVMEALRGLRTLHQTRRLVIVAFLMGVAIGAVVPLLTVYAMRVTGCTESTAQRVFLALMLSSAAGMPLAGWLTDRLGARPILMCGLGLISVASALAMAAHSVPQLAAAMVVAGLGNAAQTASSYPLLTRVVPPEEIGFYTGLQNSATGLAMPLTAAASGWLADSAGIRLVLLPAVIISAMAAVALTGLRPEAAPAEIARHRAQRATGVT